MNKKYKKIFLVCFFIFFSVIIANQYFGLFTEKYFSKEKIKLTISTDKKEYSPGEIIKINTSIYNNSSDNIRYYTECVSPNIEKQFPGTVAIETKYGNIYPNQEGIDNNIVCAGENSLKPSELKKGAYEWNQEINIPASNIQLPSGEYEIIVRFTNSYDYDKEAEFYEASTKIKITGNEKEFLTKDRAREIALSDQKISDWYKKHQGKNIIKKDEEKCFVECHTLMLLNDELCWNLEDNMSKNNYSKENGKCYFKRTINKQLYPKLCEEIEHTKPEIKEILIKEDSQYKWYILMLEYKIKKLCEELVEGPIQIGVKIDAYSGEILEKVGCEIPHSGEILPHSCFPLN